MQTRCLELGGKQSFVSEAIWVAGGKAPAGSPPAERCCSRAGAAGSSLAPGRGHSRREPGQAGTRLPGLRDRSYGRCQPDPARPRTSASPAASLRGPAAVPARSGGSPALRPPRPSAAAPPAPGPAPPSAAEGTRGSLTSGGRYGGLLAFPPRLRPFFFFVLEPPPPPGAGPPRPRSAAPAPPPAGRQQPPNSSDTRESMADTAAPPPRGSARSALLPPGPAGPAPAPASPTAARRPGKASPARLQRRERPARRPLETTSPGVPRGATDSSRTGSIREG